MQASIATGALQYIREEVWVDPEMGPIETALI